MSRNRHSHGPSEVLQRAHVRAEYQQAQRRLGAEIRRLRLARGWTQEQAAEEIGVHPKQVQRMELGSTNSTLAVLVATALALEVPLPELFGETAHDDG